MPASTLNYSARCALQSVLVGLMLSAAACSSRSAKAPSASASKESPVAVEMKGATVNNGELQVTALLVPKTAIPADDVAVVLRGLGDGKVVREEVKGVREVFPVDTLEKGQRVLFSFAMESAGLSEYQLAATWGDEAKALLQKQKTALPITSAQPEVVSADADTSSNDERDRSAAQSTTTQLIAKLDDTVPSQIDGVVRDKNDSKNREAIEGAARPPIAAGARGRINENQTLNSQGILVITGSDIRPDQTACSQAPCPKRVAVEVELYNDSAQHVSEIVLGAGLYWRDQGIATKFPEDGMALTPNESAAELDAVVLGPGERRTVRVRIDRDIPELPFGSFEPHIRIVTYKRHE